MQQLSGSEQRVLHQIIVEHVEPNQLGWILVHSDLPKLHNLAAPGDHPQQVAEVIDKLSKSFEIIPLVEGILKELRSCPPLQQWLDANKAELSNREEAGHSRTVRPKPMPKRRTRLFAAGVLAVGTLSLLGLLFRPLDCDLVGAPQITVERLPPVNDVHIAGDRKAAVIASPSYKLSASEFPYFAFKLQAHKGSLPRHIQLKAPFRDNMRIGATAQSQPPYHIERIGVDCDLPLQTLGQSQAVVLVFIPYDSQALDEIERLSPLEFLDHIP